MVCGVNCFTYCVHKKRIFSCYWTGVQNGVRFVLHIGVNLSLQTRQMGSITLTRTYNTPHTDT